MKISWNEFTKMVNKHVARGNKKLPDGTWIFNSGTAKDCPSRALGLCQCASKCYAFKAERQYYKTVPAYRARQEAIAAVYSGEDFAKAILEINARARTKMSAFRFNESGDFQDQTKVDWFVTVCKILSEAGIRCYGYTARTDLDLSGLLEVATVMVSNDLGGWVEKGANRFRAVEKYNPENINCAGDCRICNVCQVARGKEIEVLIH